MKCRTCVLAIAAVIGLAAAPRAQGGPDEQSLKVAHETVIGSVVKGNLTILQAMIHPQASGFFHASQQPVQLGGGLSAADVLPTLLTDLGMFQTVPTDTKYRLVGPVGVVNLTAFLDSKKFGQTDRYVRGTYVYLSEGGNWKLLSWHSSNTPLKK